MRLVQPEVLHDKVPGSIPPRRLKFASASLMRSQGRGRGRWGEWWRGGVGSNPRKGRGEGPGPCVSGLSSVECEALPGSIAATLKI